LALFLLVSHDVDLVTFFASKSNQFIFVPKSIKLATKKYT